MTNWDEIIKDVHPLNKKVGRFSLSKIKTTFKKKHLKPLKSPVYYPTLDLHGKTIDESFTSLEKFFELQNGKTVIIITGKSGELKKIFPRWCIDGVLKKYVKNLKPENIGSFKLNL